MISHFTMRKYGVNQQFDLLKALVYIERVVKSEKCLGKALFYIIRAQHVLSYNHLT